MAAAGRDVGAAAAGVERPAHREVQNRLRRVDPLGVARLLDDHRAAERRRLDVAAQRQVGIDDRAHALRKPELDARRRAS